MSKSIQNPRSYETRIDCKRCKCKNAFRKSDKCAHCGVSKYRKVTNGKSHKGSIGGKRGRNSGKVSQHGKKN